MISLSLAGCSSIGFGSKPEPIDISFTPVDKPELTLPNADELNLRSVEWIIITPENFEEKVAEATQSGRPIAFFALTDDGYEKLGLNLSDVRAYVQQQQAIIAAYELYYTNAEKALANAVTVN